MTTKRLARWVCYLSLLIMFGCWLTAIWVGPGDHTDGKFGLTGLLMLPVAGISFLVSMPEDWW